MLVEKYNCGILEHENIKTYHKLNLYFDTYTFPEQIISVTIATIPNEIFIQNRATIIDDLSRIFDILPVSVGVYIVNGEYVIDKTKLFIDVRHEIDDILTGFKKLDKCE